MHEDSRFYPHWLKEYALNTGSRIDACVLMTNHVHLPVSAEAGNSVGALIKALGQRYVQYVNRSYRRSGTLWEGRLRLCLTQEERYLLALPARHRTQPRSRRLRWAPVRVSLVELSREGRGRGRFVGRAASAVSCIGSGPVNAASRQSRPLPKSAGYRTKRKAPPRNERKFCSRRLAVCRADLSNNWPTGKARNLRSAAQAPRHRL
ncbi:transposase [Accumulibacter sp.]|uniref:transposase n=1 Tax=Accumulibacter sp. TaxID=2053492 RepID=UPI0028C506B6|nr:transposase [Accumulibacter sp.]